MQNFTTVKRASALRRRLDLALWSRYPLRLALLVLFPAVFSPQMVFSADVVRLTRDGKLKEDLAWAPVGDRLACSYYERPGRIGIAVLDAALANWRVLTTDPVSRAPGWTPDGKRLAFIHVTQSGTDGELEIYGMDVDGSNRKVLVPMPTRSFENFPSYSPDGKHLLFTTTRDKTQEIYSCDAEGKNLQRLTKDPSLKQYPRWSPDGRMIAYNSNQDGNFDIYVMNADGTGTRRLTTDPGADVCPAWCPDGKRLAFVSSRDENPEIYVVNLDGSGLRNVSRYEGYDYSPAWKPDGRTLSWVSDRDNQYDVYSIRP